MLAFAGLVSVTAIFRFFWGGSVAGKCDFGARTARHNLKNKNFEFFGVSAFTGKKRRVEKTKCDDFGAFSIKTCKNQPKIAPKKARM